MIIRYACGSQMMGQIMKSLQNIIKVAVSVLNYNLEGTEEFSSQYLALLSSLEVLEGHLDCSRLVRTIAIRNLVILEWDASK